MRPLQIENLKTLLVVSLLLLAISLLASCKDEDPTAPSGANHSPAVPALNTAAGAPADNAIAISLNPTLHWNCTDSDGDPMTYTIHFGQEVTPGMVSSGQTGTSYSPATLDYSTSYFWKIVARDNGGLSTSSPTWSFTTLSVDDETITTPNPPEGPTTGETMTTLVYNFSGAESSYGHPLYYRLDDGAGNISAWQGGTSRGVSWTSPGTYELKVQAVCQNHPGVISEWSESLSVTITNSAEIIQQPEIWYYSTIGGINEDFDFAVQHVSSNLMHELEVQFDWNDGSFSEWIPVQNTDAAGTHSWSSAGTFQVKAKARCIEHPTAISEWTAFPDLVIADVETITTPIQIPADEQTVGINEWAQIDIPGVINNMGHLMEYMFDYGDGRQSLWQSYSDQVGNAIKYSVVGDFPVRSQVRCIEHPDVISDWSAPSIIHVVEEEHISPPVLSGPSTGTVNTPVEFTVSGAESSFGHDLEYQLSWSHTWPPYGPNYQEWTTADNLSITWDSPSNSIFVYVTARCIEDPEVIQAGNHLFLSILE